jgi:UDP:flavonoid glycosyltransferase YjiC (YdhE family)
MAEPAAVVSPPVRIMIAAVGWAGHLFPALALGRELARRGNEVLVETFGRWREVVEGAGLGFAAARERMSFGAIPDPDEGPTLAQAARELEPLLAEHRPDLLVHDLFTLAPAFAAERAGIRRATLIPHPYPVHEPGLPLYPLGLGPPRTTLGALGWRALWPAIGTRLPNTRLRRVRGELDRERAELGLKPLADYDGQISGELALVATFPQLEYPRRWPDHVHVTGPMPYELPHPEAELPPGGEPLVVVAPSTERDPEMRLIAAALEGLAAEPVRVVASANRADGGWRGPVPANARVVDWLSYAQAMPQASLVVCHGGHGTIARALSEGVPVLVCPPAGDMAENGARVAWSGSGRMLPNRLLSPASLRWSARGVLAEPAIASRAAEIAAWTRSNHGAATAAALVERAARS